MALTVLTRTLKANSNKYEIHRLNAFIYKENSTLTIDDMSLAWPALVQLLLVHSRISHEYSSLFIIVINLIFMFSL